MGKGKAEFMTPKAIANRMKAKGLQKLRWFCQLCNKQCRDENGFKCHSESEGHKRQLSLFASRPGKFLDTYSHEFEKCFLDELKRRFGTKRVHANLVYNEYIRDKNHTHMNATKWTTLSGFVRYLGKTGKCVVDETPKGWYISYINRDPEAIARQEALAKKERMDVTDEERTKQIIEKRLLELAKMGIEPGKDDEIDDEEEPFDPTQPHEAIKFSLKPISTVKLEPESPHSTNTTTATTDTTTTTTDSTPSIKPEPKEEDEATREPAFSSSSSSSSSPAISTPTTPSPVPTPPTGNSKGGVNVNFKPFNAFDIATKSTKDSKEKEKEKDKDKERERAKEREESDNKEPKDNKRKKTAMELLMEDDVKQKEKRNRRDDWITPGIVVKIMNKNLGDGKYYKAKGVILETEKYIAQIKVLDIGDVLKLDQGQLETVIPAIGAKVKIVNGAYRGDTAVLQSLDVDNFSAKVKLVNGSCSGKTLSSIAYEDICKIHAQ